MKNGFVTTGPTLTEQLPADKRGAYLKAVTDLGADPRNFDRMKPWLVGVTLSLAPIQKLGYDPKNGPETVLAEAARRRTSRSPGWKPPNSRSASSTPVAKGADRVPDLDHRRLPRRRGNGRDGRRMGQGDPDALAKTMNGKPEGLARGRQDPADDRNARWATWIKQVWPSPAPVFIAVGAGHLAGNDSVQAQLAKQGIKAQRIAY